MLMESLLRMNDRHIHGGKPLRMCVLVTKVKWMDFTGMWVSITSLYLSHGTQHMFNKDNIELSNNTVISNKSPIFKMSNDIK